MTNRIQVLRSSVTGNVPTAGTRAAGELWVNFPDLQLGAIDASRNAQRLIAVRYFSATANYATGDFVIQAGALYAAKGAVTAGAFNVTQWNLIGSATTGPYLPLAGGTMTGTLTLQGPPANPLEAATKAYVDAGAFVPTSGGANTGLNDNRIINGDFRIDQHNNGASGTAQNNFAVDRWTFGATLATKGTWGRNLNAIAGPVGFPYYLGFQSNSAYTVLAGDYFTFLQAIEADMVSDFAWGTAGAQPVTLSFWVRSSLTGTFGGAINNYTATRSYPFTYSVPAANTWTKIVITIPGDTAGTWVMSGNIASASVWFGLGVGSTLSGPANAWASANYVSANGATSIVGANAATFYVTGVKLEIGSIATSYNRQSSAQSLADCQRYFQKIGGVTFADLIIQGYASNSGMGAISMSLGIYPMRAAPTAAVVGTMSVTNVNGVSLNGGLQVLGIQLSATAVGACAWYSGGTTAYLTLSAEL